MVKPSPAWGWVATLVEKTQAKPHPEVQCKYCSKVIRNCQLGRDLLPHAAYKCANAPADVKETARAEIEKAAELKKKRKPSGGAAPQRAKKPKNYLSRDDEDVSDESEETAKGLKKRSYFATPFESDSEDDENDGKKPFRAESMSQRKIEITVARMLNGIDVPFSDIKNELFTYLASLNPRAKMMLPTAARLREVMPARTHSVRQEVVDAQMWAATDRRWAAREHDDESME